MTTAKPASLREAILQVLREKKEPMTKEEIFVELEKLDWRPTNEVYDFAVGTLEQKDLVEWEGEKLKLSA